MPVRLVIFDLDGTLVDSALDLCNAVNYAIEPYGIEPVTVDETKSLVGEGITRLMEKVAARGITSRYSADSQRLKFTLVERFLEHYSAHIVDNTRPYPYVRETLETLGSFKKAVISNKREGASSVILEILGLASYLDLIVGSDTTRQRKPSPIPVLYVLDTFALRPEEAVIVGDSNLDIEAGRAAGIRTVGATWGYRSLEALKDADFLIKGMDELPGILNELI